MKRIDSINARANANGTGKTGFSDNADLAGQDATYLTPDWLNHIQEELCNLLELNGISLNTNSRQQLFELLTTQTELNVLAAEIENNFLRKTENAVSASKLQTAREIKLQGAASGSAQFDGSGNIIIDLVSNLDFSALKAASGYQKLPNGLIFQWVNTETVTVGAGSNTTKTVSLPITFPNATLISVVSGSAVNLSCGAKDMTTSSITAIAWNLAGGAVSGIMRVLAIGY